MTATQDQASVLRYVSSDATPMTDDGVPVCAACRQRFPEDNGYYVSVLDETFCLDCGSWAHEHGVEQMRRRVDPTDTPTDALADYTLRELYEIVAVDVYAWLDCPCDYHAFNIGVAAGAVAGSTQSVVRTAVAILHDKIDAGELDLPSGVDELRLDLVVPSLFPAG